LEEKQHRPEILAKFQPIPTLF